MTTLTAPPPVAPHTAGQRTYRTASLRGDDGGTTIAVDDRGASAPADFARFCEEQHRRLVASTTAFCGDALLAEEIAQEALVKACERWERVRVMDAPGAWLHRVALNLARSRFRRKAIERRVMSGQREADHHRDADVADAVDLHRALAELAPRRRTVVVLRHVAGLSVTETAEAMGISETAVRSLASRALGELRSAMEVVEVSRRG